MKHPQILNFIKTIRESIDGAEFMYSHGSCYQFYLILKCVIPEAIAYTNCDHVITKIGNRFYDVTGEVECSTHIPVDEDEKRELTKLKFKINQNENIQK